MAEGTRQTLVRHEIQHFPQSPFEGDGEVKGESGRKMGGKRDARSSWR